MILKELLSLHEAQEIKNAQGFVSKSATKYQKFADFRNAVKAAAEEFGVKATVKAVNDSDMSGYDIIVHGNETGVAKLFQKFVMKKGTSLANSLAFAKDSVFEDIELTEKVHTIRNPKVKPRGAPEQTARAFLKKNHNHSVLKKLAKQKSKEYHAVESSDEGEYVMVLMMKADDEHRAGDDYYGVNVLFYPNGRIDASTADDTADKQWKTDRAAIIAAAKKALKDEGELSVNID